MTTRSPGQICSAREQIHPRSRCERVRTPRRHDDRWDADDALNELWHLAIRESLELELDNVDLASRPRVVARHDETLSRALPIALALEPASRTWDRRGRAIVANSCRTPSRRRRPAGSKSVAGDARASRLTMRDQGMGSPRAPGADFPALEAGPSRERLRRFRPRPLDRPSDRGRSRRVIRLTSERAGPPLYRERPGSASSAGPRPGRRGSRMTPRFPPFPMSSPRPRKFSSRDDTTSERAAQVLARGYLVRGAGARASCPPQLREVAVVPDPPRPHDPA